MGLTAADLRAALDFIRRISAVDDPDEFAHRATAGLYRLVGCDFVSYNELNLKRGRTLLFTEPYEALQPDAQEAFGRNLAQHPIAVHYATHGGGPALRMSDFITLRQFRRTSLYDELFVPVGGNFVLAVPLPVPAGIVVGFGLVRRAPDFADRDRELLELLRPHLALAYERSLLRASVGSLADAAERGEARLIMLDLAGDPLYMTEPAAASLERFFPAAPSDGGLPAPVQAWLARGATDQLRVARDGSALCIDPLGGRPSALLLTEAATRASPEALRRLGLTRREAEVLALVAEGRSNADVARLLVVSPRTVKKHLENVYGKLGVGTRTAAAAAALAAS